MTHVSMLDYKNVQWYSIKLHILFLSWGIIFGREDRKVYVKYIKNVNSLLNKKNYPYLSRNNLTTFLSANLLADCCWLTSLKWKGKYTITISAENCYLHSAKVNRVQKNYNAITFSFPKESKMIFFMVGHVHGVVVNRIRI